MKCQELNFLDHKQLGKCLRFQVAADTIQLLPTFEVLSNYPITQAERGTAEYMYLLMSVARSNCLGCNELALSTYKAYWCTCIAIGQSFIINAVSVANSWSMCAR